VPFVDRLLPLLDLREQVVSFPPQPVITEDNLVVNIDSVIYFQVTDPSLRHVRDRQLHPGRRAAHR
jgi:regulator of protease activity HflC (stomatin/prohibitin superfamily)